VDIPGTYTAPYWNFHEDFVDLVGDSGHVHPCQHTLYMARHHDIPRLNTYLGNWAEFVPPLFKSSLWADELVPLFPGPTDADKARLAEEAFNAFYVQMPQQVSIPNFVWELRELGDMIPKIEESLTKTVAGGYLTYEFGYLPFVSDVTKLRNLAKTVASRLAYLRRTYGVETRVSCEGTFSVDSQVVTSTRDGEQFRFTVPSYIGRYRAGGYLFQRLNELYGLESIVRGFAGALGLNNPVGVLWEAIPYSFVADWFTRTKEIVNHAAVNPFTGDWEIRRLTHSFHWEVPYVMDYLHPLGDGTFESFIAEEGSAKVYTRNNGLPVPSGVLSQEGLDPRQQMLAAALLASLK
jgi:hypothetical protein